MKFTAPEIKDISITIVSLSIILVLKDLSTGLPWMSSMISALLVVSTSLIIKLIMQKITAQKYDCDAVYKFNYNLFFIAVLLALITNGAVVFAAIGSIMITSSLYTRLGHKFVNITQRETGLVALSGPLANIIFSLLSIVLYPINPSLFQSFLNFNVFMALFNLIPFPPLDGSKVIWWNRLLWLIFFLITIFLFFLGRTALFTVLGIILLVILTFVLWEKMF